MRYSVTLLDQYCTFTMSTCARFMSSLSSSKTMLSLSSYSYGDYNSLQLNANLRIPMLRASNELLVRVAASSINPIDLAVLRGYGSTLFPLPGRLLYGKCEFPLILGRDFSGTVVSVGPSVTRYRPGDEIFGCKWPFEDGCHAEYAVVNEDNIHKKPSRLQHTDAAAVPYSGLTACSLLQTFQCPFIWPAKSASRTSKVLVIGASGGVGVILTQLCALRGYEVTAVCPKLFQEQLSKSFANKVHEVIAIEDLPLYLQQSASMFDAIFNLFDPSFDTSMRGVLKLGGSVVTLQSPLLGNVDSHGIIPGVAQSISSLLWENVRHGVGHFGSYRWSFFAQSGSNLKKLHDLVESGQLTTFSRVFSIQDYSAAFTEENKLGRVVLSISSIK